MRTEIKASKRRINVKVYESLGRNGTTAKWDRDVQKRELKREGDSRLEFQW
jgi:phage-related protein